MIRSICFVSLALLMHSSNSMAYDLATHAHISLAATAQSVLADPAKATQLGLNETLATNLGDYYFDVASDLDGMIVVRKASTFESSGFVMPGVDESRAISKNPLIVKLVQGWLMRGAIREDDGRPLITANPSEDVLGPINRFCNHFYDPRFNVKLLSGCPEDNLTSAPLWALGVRTAGDTSGAMARPTPLSPRDPARRNHYSLHDAREAMWRALTLRSFKNPSGALLTDNTGELAPLPSPIHQTIARFPFSSDPSKASSEYRNAYWATAMFGLGTMMHLNQDMAQPQHTRPEIHPLFDRAEFERYIDARAVQEFKPVYKTKVGNYPVKFPLEPLSYLSTDGRALAPPEFRELSDFWSTQSAIANIKSGLGLADYSNSRFFTLAHNLGNGVYSEPTGDFSKYRLSQQTDQLGAKHTYVDGNVIDPLTGASDVIHMSRPTLLNEALTELGYPISAVTPGGPKYASYYTLDWRIYDDYAKLLIPKAVAYSTGIINWFFRGQLKISAPDEGVYAIVDHARESDPATGGFTRMKLKVANSSAGEPIGAGYVVAVAKFHRDRCYTATLSSGRPANMDEAISTCRSPDEEIVVSKPLMVATLSVTPTPFTFEFPTKVPINATDLYVQIVFRGQLGNESDAIAVATKDLYEPTYFAYQNSTDYMAIRGKLYAYTKVLEVGVPLTALLPRECVGSSTESTILYCFAPDSVSTTFDFGPTNIVVDQLLPRQYVRFAYIADTAITTFNKTGDCGPISYRTENVKWQVDESETRRLVYIPRYFGARGIFGNFQGLCIERADPEPIADEHPTDAMTPIAGTQPTPIKSLNF